jgi:hypothetical protein
MPADPTPVIDLNADPNADPATGDPAAPVGSETPADLDAYFATLPDDQQKVVKGLYEAQTANLNSALRAERAERKAERNELSKQLKDLAAKSSGAEKAALEQVQAEFQTKLEAAEKRADFASDAASAGVKDVRMAWAAIKEYDLHDRRGDPDLVALKEKCPYLFASEVRPVSRVNAGTGTGTAPAAADDFNTRLRKQLGVST